MTGTVDVWRLEHTVCKIYPNHGPYFTFNKRGQKKYVDSRSACGAGRPEFGKAGAAPESIGAVSRCGVRFSQLEYWWAPVYDWEYKLGFWTKHNWFFVVYTMKKHNVRADRDQIVFNPNRALSSRIIDWKEVPKPKNSFI